MKYWFFPIGFLLTTACHQTSSTQQTQDSVKTGTAAITALPEKLSELDTVTIGNVLYNIIDIDKAEFDAGLYTFDGKRR